MHDISPHGASGRALEPYSYLKLRILHPCMIFLHMVLPVGQRTTLLPEAQDPASMHDIFPYGASGRATEPHSYLKLRILHPCMIFLHMVFPVGQ
jgi:hypothetical protein